MLSIVSVVLIGRGARYEYSYFTRHNCRPGDLVVVGFGRSKRLGLVITSGEVKDRKMAIRSANFKLSSIEGLLGVGVSPDVLDFLVNFSIYSGLPLGEFLYLALPRFAVFATRKVGTLSIARHQTHPGPKLQYVSGVYEDRIIQYLGLINKHKLEHHKTLIVVPSLGIAQSLKKHLEGNIQGVKILGYGLKSNNLGISRLSADINNNKVYICPPSMALLLIGNVQLCIIERASATYGSNILPSYSYKQYLTQLCSFFGVELYLGDIAFDLSSSQYLPKIPNLGDANKMEVALLPIGVGAMKYTESILNKLESDILLVVPNRDLGRLIVCLDCKSIFSCKKCLFPLTATIKNKERMYSCARCSSRYAIDTRCYNCGSWNVKTKVEGKQSYQELIKNYCQSHKEKKVVIMTLEESSQLTTSHFNTILVQPEYVLGSHNYRSIELFVLRTLNLLSFTKNHFTIITSLGDNPTLQYLANGRWNEVLNNELELRRKFKYPPFEVIVKITEIFNSKKGPVINKHLRANFPNYTYSEYLSPTGNASVSIFTVLLKFDSLVWPDKQFISSVLSLGPNVNVEVNPNKIV